MRLTGVLNRHSNYLFLSWVIARLTLRSNPNCDLRLTLVATSHEVGCRTGSSSNENLAARFEAHRRMPATWSDIIIGIWVAWFIALVIISIAQSMWQSRDRWRLQTKRWWRSRSWARKPYSGVRWMLESARADWPMIDAPIKRSFPCNGYLRLADGTRQPVRIIERFAPKSIEGNVSCCWGYAG